MKLRLSLSLLDGLPSPGYAVERLASLQHDFDGFGLATLRTAGRCVWLWLRKPTLTKQVNSDKDVVEVKGVKDKVVPFWFVESPDLSYVQTTGSPKDIGLLVMALPLVGVKGATAVPLLISFKKWAKAIQARYDAVQLKSVKLANMFVEPRMIGGYDAKSVDNRLDIGYIEEHAGQITALSIAFFKDGIKHSVEVTAKGQLTITCSDEDSAEGFLDDMKRLLLTEGLE